MAGVGAPFDSLRFSGLESRRLALALALSLTAHLLAWGGYEAWQTARRVATVASAGMVLMSLKIKIQPVRPVVQETRTIGVCGCEPGAGDG